jgi:CDP-diglyceride synthetase
MSEASERIPAPPPAVHVVVPGLLTTMTAAALAAAAFGGRPALALVLLPVQIAVVVAWLAVLDVEGAVGGMVVGIGAAVVADVLALDGVYGLRRLAGAVGVSLLVALVHQLVRRDGRPGLTASLTATVSVAALVVGASVLVALRTGEAGTDAVETSLAALAAATVVARVVDALIHGPAIAASPRRGWPGFVAGIAAGVLCGGVVGSARGLGTGDAAVLAGSVAVIALAFELGTDLARSAIPRRQTTLRARSGLVPLSVFLPVCAIGPAAYVAGRILLG